ncbi:MAG: hypothetical protein AB7N76_22940 [Planctomycetota bacterium]
MTEQELEAILAGERETDLTEAESEELMAFIETERGRELLAQAEREVDPLAEAYDPELPGDEAWVRVDRALQRELEAGAEDRLVVTPPALPAAPPNWGGTLLLAAALLFAAALALAVLGPGKSEHAPLENTMTPGGSPRPLPELHSPQVPLSAAPEEPVELNPPAAVVVRVEAGQGFEARTETREDALLIVSVREKAPDPH